MHLLTGLVVLVIVYALLRAVLPGRRYVPGVVVGVAAATLVAFFPRDLFEMPFWAGAVGFVAILSALMVVMHPNPMVSVLFLILNLFCVALFFLMLQAQILAALQVIVYAGAIMVLFVFVVMLLNLKSEEGLRAGRGVGRWAAVALGALFAGMMFHAIRNRAARPFFRPATFIDGFGTAKDLGDLLFRDYVFVFEAASVLLVAAMVGAVLLAKRRLQ
jgi:NADH-quinone oxidoreductase subunit J